MMVAPAAPLTAETRASQGACWSKVASGAIPLVRECVRNFRIGKTVGLSGR
jgi:hypothetical protein